MRAPTTSGRRAGAEAGFTIVEVLVAAVILALGAAATFGVLASTVRNAQRAKATQVALDRAQEEVEKLHSLPYDELAMTTTPPHSNKPLNPNYRVRSGDGAFALVREPPSEYATMVVENSPLYGTEEYVEGAVVTPGPFPFESGDVSGELYRYVVWRNDSKCGVDEETEEELCPGGQDYKQIVVAVKLDKGVSQTAERGYVEVQSKVIDPESQAEPPEEGGEGGEGEGGGGGGGGGSAVTAQQFFLSDTPCSDAGTTEREEITGDHLLHNTLGTCASGPQTGTTVGAPDALLLGAPPDPDPLDESNPPLYDYANDGYLEPNPDTDKGVQIKRDDTSGCNYTPTGPEHPESQAHRWVTDPLATSFSMNGKVTLEFYTRTLNDALYHGTLCVYLFKRAEEVDPVKEELVANDSILEDPSTAKLYWTYEPQGNGYWPRNSWTKVRLTMEFTPDTIKVDERLGVALTVDPGNTDAEAIPIMYDHPNYPTRIEVDTTTPIESGEGE